MAIITGSKKSGYDQNGAGSKLQQLKIHLQSNSNFGASADERLKALADGSFESAGYSVFGETDSLASALNYDLSFEHDVNGVAIPGTGNSVGLQVASFLESLAGGDLNKYLATFNAESQAPAEGTTLATAHGSEWKNFYSTESFDNQKLNEFLPISIGLNYAVSRQRPAMELVFRTIALTPDQGGLDIEIPNLYVKNKIRHDLNGGQVDWGLRRVIDAEIDYTILNDNVTKVIPHWTDTSKSKFISDTLVTPWEQEEGKERKVVTSYLKVGATINLFGLNNDQIARNGVPDYTEALDRNVGVNAVALVFGQNVIHFDTEGLPYSRFIKNPEQGLKGIKLNFPIKSIILDKDTTDYEGNELTGGVWDLIKTGEYSVRLKTQLDGQGDVDKGDFATNPWTIEVHSITGPTGVNVALDSGVGLEIVTAISAGKIDGWIVGAQLTNSNNRYLGQLLDVRGSKERFITKTRWPFFIPYPVQEERDNRVMEYLTYAVGTYMNSEAIGYLIGYHERQMRYSGGKGLRGELIQGDFEENGHEIEGVARKIMNPYIQTVPVNLTKAQSLQTVENITNAQEVLRNNVRSVIFDIYQVSGYEAACRFMDGGDGVRKHRFAMVTSPTIKRFMTLNGDTRTLGADINFQLESDIDARLKKVMYMTIVRDGEGVDILSGGINLLTPSLVSNLQASRDGTVRQEVVVQPRFQQYMLLPILVKFEIEGVEELLEEQLPFLVATKDAEVDGDDNTGGNTGNNGGTTPPVVPGDDNDTGGGTAP